jgi:hypothetical protein
VKPRHESKADGGGEAFPKNEKITLKNEKSATREGSRSADFVFSGVTGEALDHKGSYLST